VGIVDITWARDHSHDWLLVPEFHEYYLRLQGYLL
jgi:hypothetical protein